MNRQVVREVPPNAVPIRPSDTRPSTSRTITEIVPASEEYPTGKRERLVDDYWHMDSDVARLLGEAKSLPKGYSLKVTGRADFTLWSYWIAWYASRLEIVLSSYRDSYYLTRSSK